MGKVENRMNRYSKIRNRELSEYASKLEETYSKL